MEGPSTQNGITVIIVRRLSGQPLAINPDLLGRIESTPDTILVMLDGTRFIVRQSMDEVVDLVREYRANVVARALRAPGEEPLEADGGQDAVILRMPVAIEGH